MVELCLFNEEFIFDNDMSTCDMFDISYKHGTGHSTKKFSLKLPKLNLIKCFSIRDPTKEFFLSRVQSKTADV